MAFLSLKTSNFEMDRLRTLLRTAWFLTILVAIVGSLLPWDSLPIRELDRLAISDKLEHLGIYALLVFLPAVHERRGVVAAAVVGAVVLGVGLEYAQLYTGWRDFEIGDMVADTIGALVGLAVGWAVRWMLHRARTPEQRPVLVLEGRDQSRRAR